MLYYISISFVSWFLADLIAGIVHWWEDHYLNNDSKFKFLNTLSKDNDLHHKDPAALTAYSLWRNIDTSAVVAWPLCLFLFLIGAPTLLYMTVFFASFANIVHRFSHEPKHKLNPVIAFIQKTGIFISGDHHRVHHYFQGVVILKEDTIERFCPMSNWVNPILDRIQFFRFLEYGLSLGRIYTTKVRTSKGE